MKIEPLNSNVVVKREESEKKTPGGLLLPDSAQKKAKHGEVLAVGPGFHDKKGDFHGTSVKVGQVVAFGDWAGTEVELDNEKYLIIPEEQLLGVVVK